MQRPIAAARFWLLAAALCSLAWLLAPGSAHAHRTSLARSEITVTGAVVEFRLFVSVHDLAVVMGIQTDFVRPVPVPLFRAGAGRLEAYLSRRLTIFSDGRTCARERPVYDYTEEKPTVTLGLAYRCPGAVERLKVVYDLFFDIDPAHRNLVSVIAGGGRQELVFDREAATLQFDVASPGAAGSGWGHFARLLKMGAAHILSGYDHLLFLLALMLGAIRFFSMVKVVTAFTAAHSITLALAWYGVLRLPPALVESLIALSIAYVAAENLLAIGLSRRWAVGFGFGLVHGLGFYGVLGALELGREQALSTLLGFNLGVELGQIAFLAPTFLLLALGGRAPWFPRAQRYASLAILAVAGVWFVQRALPV